MKVSTSLGVVRLSRIQSWSVEKLNCAPQMNPLHPLMNRLRLFPLQPVGEQVPSRLLGRCRKSRLVSGRLAILVWASLMGSGVVLVA